MNILVIGSGGREHAFAWKIHQSPACEKLFVAPGNAGTADIATNVDLSPEDFPALGEFILEKNVGLVVVGPEAPLVAGIRDYFREDPRYRDVMVIGPSREASQLEGSKDYAKQFMERHGIPTGKARTFKSDQLEEGLAYLRGLEPPYVLKADGLAAGKGVIISPSLEEAEKTLREMLIHKQFGAASSRVLIEEHLSGIELSVFVLTDGKDYVTLPEAKDYKRIGEGDTGPNTGGMGAVTPVPFATPAFMSKVEERIIKPTIRGIHEEGLDYVGFVFIGLMNVNGDPYVIEYNVRMGDPETQAVFPRVKNDFVSLLSAAGQQKLSEIRMDINPAVATTVIMASGGYPASYEKGKRIEGVDNVENAMVFHAGTRKENGNLVTSGGRVLAITGEGSSITEALTRAYQGIEKIRWDEAYYRKDIGQDLMQNA